MCPPFLELIWKNCHSLSTINCNFRGEQVDRSNWCYEGTMIIWWWSTKHFGGWVTVWHTMKCIYICLFFDSKEMCLIERAFFNAGILRAVANIRLTDDEYLLSARIFLTLKNSLISTYCKLLKLFFCSGWYNAMKLSKLMFCNETNYYGRADCELGDWYMHSKERKKKVYKSM